MPEASPFCLLETMRWERGIALLDRHLARLKRSATALDFTFDEPQVRDSLGQYEALLEDDRAYRVRLTLDRGGGTHVTVNSIDADSPVFRRAVLHPVRIESDGRLRPFKTTLRAPYEEPYRLARSRGYNEAILLNERGEVVEGTRTNVWVRLGGKWLTPPVESGCLGGVYRAHMLDEWENAYESVLSMRDLLDADEIALSNAVHGFQPVEVVADP